MYRPKYWNKNERELQKEKKKKDWYKKGGHESVIFVPPTHNSNLRKAMEKEVKNTSFKIKVVETAGDSIKSMLQKSDPFPANKCSDPQCMVCSKGGKGNCRASNVTYKIVCSMCTDIYYGETCRNCYSRGKEHITYLNNKTDNSVLYRHITKNTLTLTHLTSQCQ